MDRDRGRDQEREGRGGAVDKRSPPTSVTRVRFRYSGISRGMSLLLVLFLLQMFFPGSPPQKNNISKFRFDVDVERLLLSSCHILGGSLLQQSPSPSTQLEASTLFSSYLAMQEFAFLPYALLDSNKFFLILIIVVVVVVVVVVKRSTLSS